ncbi:hypothetical protein HYPSUDRAFT_1049344 [Hypholoma sublateritium FD-334 SS-4]|uniref:Uncharacterized protein n=1 Tax=Hypholoma sublateritium (strain FD-334 SS-4) TaxID=945553 RepID=A0A0D2NCN8_HYPSF|nr:hypothetical protein HYPSUDRAFT_1049344 [Hypholoma sublateritium FD-334 SS-4]
MAGEIKPTFKFPSSSIAGAYKTVPLQAVISSTGTNSQLPNTQSPLHPPPHKLKWTLSPPSPTTSLPPPSRIDDCIEHSYYLHCQPSSSSFIIATTINHISTLPQPFISCTGRLSPFSTRLRLHPITVLTVRLSRNHFLSSRFRRTRIGCIVEDVKRMYKFVGLLQQNAN